MRCGSFLPLAAAAARAGCGLAGLAGAVLAFLKGGRAGREPGVAFASPGRESCSFAPFGRWEPPEPDRRGGPDFFGGSTG